MKCQWFGQSGLSECITVIYGVERLLVTTPVLFILFQVQLIIRSARLAHELNEFLEVAQLAVRGSEEGCKADKSYVALQLEVVSALWRDHDATWLDKHS